MNDTFMVTVWILVGVLAAVGCVMLIRSMFKDDL